MAIVYGFAGLRIKEDYISLNPRLPEKWKELKFKFLYRGACINVDMQKEKTIISAQCDNPINLKINDLIYELKGNAEILI
jgi:trehalose/maltose hydrolase-like predicted phosphorylase